ncbi:hypothetical protein Tco_1476264 [Tanacetum coccineum]
MAIVLTAQRGDGHYAFMVGEYGAYGVPIDSVLHIFRAIHYRSSSKILNHKSVASLQVKPELGHCTTSALSIGKRRAKCDLLINNICEVFNRQLVNDRDQPIITCLEYIREYLMKRIVVVQQVHAAYRLETWAHVYSFKVNPCNGRDMWPIVESRTVIIPPLYKPPIGRPPKKRKKSNDEIASQSASSGKLSRKGKSVSCGKCGNVGHNMKGCRGQGGGSSQTGAMKVSSQAVGSRKVFGQAAGARNVSGQAAGARKASSQPSAAQSTANQGPRQGFQGPIAGPASGSQRKTKKLMDL